MKKLAFPALKQLDMRLVVKIADIYRQTDEKKLARYGLSILIACNSLRATHEEIEVFCDGFSELHPCKQNLERSFALSILLTLEKIREFSLKNAVYKPAQARFAYEYHYAPKRILEREIYVADMLNNGYLGRKKVVGKQSVGFCCSQSKINKLEEEKIISISEIKEIQYQKNRGLLKIIPF